MNEADLRREVQELRERLERLERHLQLERESTAPDQRAAGPKVKAFHRLFSSAAGATSAEASSQAHIEPEPITASAPTVAPVHPPTAPPVRPPPIPRSPREPAVIPLKPAPPPIAPPAAPSSHAAQPPSPPAAPPPIAPWQRDELDERATEPDADATLDDESLAAATEPRSASGAPLAPFEATPSQSWEQLIGGKWMAWVGALVVVLAAGFAVKVGIDQGWWGRLPPVVRCLSIAAFGGMLLVGGEFALRRIGKPAAAGLISAGLGTLYLDAFAASRFFNLLPTTGAFVLMGIVALGGFAMTVRTRFLTIGVLSIIGGYLTPILLRGDSTHDLELLLYLTMLLGVSLTLSGWMPRPFASMRFVALGAHMLVATGWIITNSALWQMAMFFMSAWWCMTLAESVYTALQRRGLVGNVVMTLAATASYVTAGCWVLHVGSVASAGWMGAFTAMVAVLGAVAAMQFGEGLDALRHGEAHSRRHPMNLLTVALWLQSGVLIATAIALQFAGLGEAIGWMALGLAAIEMGRRLNSRGVVCFGLIAGALAVFRAVTLTALTRGTLGASLDEVLLTIAGFEISRWALLMIVTVAAMHVAAHRLPPDEGWRIARRAIVVLASMVWMGLCVAQAERLSITGAWLAYAIALLAMRRLAYAERAAYSEVALVMLAFTAARWLLFDALMHRVAPGWNAAEATPVLNWQMGMAVAIAATAWWACRALGRRQWMLDQSGVPISSRAATMWQVALVLGAVFSLIAVCFEIDRGVSQTALNQGAGAFSVAHVRQLLFTLAWAMGSVIVAVIARTIVSGGSESGAAITRTWLLRRFAWSVLIMCAAKWALWDAPALLVVNRPLFNAALPLANLQMMTGVALAVALLVLRAAMPTSGKRETHAPPRSMSMVSLPRDLASWMPVAACVMLLWGLTFEVDRLLARSEPLPSWLDAYEALQVRALWWTALWTLGALAMFFVGQARQRPAMIAASIIIGSLTAIAWLTVDTISWRITMQAPVDVTPLLNLQFAVGELCAAALVVMARAVQRSFAGASDLDIDQAAASEARTVARVMLAGVGLIGLWLGSIEIDRIFDHAAQVRQAGLSVWWALYAVGLVGLGFARQLAAVRYAGLALLSLTAVKVLAIDLASLDTLPRVMSLAVAGLLLIATSVVYARLSPMLLRERDT